jgi:hypothetical protein
LGARLAAAGLFTALNLAGEGDVTLLNLRDHLHEVMYIK